MIVFLDFDGVTHGLSKAAFNGICLAQLDDVFTEHAAQVVIISSWRYDYPLEKMVTKLRQVGRHVVGVAPEISGGTRTPRQTEVESWLAGSAYAGPWLAIDDKPEWYGDLAGQVIAPDPRVGFQAADAAAFRQLVKEMSDNGFTQALSQRFDALTENMNRPGAADATENALFGDPAALSQTYGPETTAQGKEGHKNKEEK